MKQNQFFLLNRMKKHSPERIQFPQNNKEALSQAFALMAFSLTIFNKEIARRFKHPKKSQILAERNKVLAGFNKKDSIAGAKEIPSRPRYLFS